MGGGISYNDDIYAFFSKVHCCDILQTSSPIETSICKLVVRALVLSLLVAKLYEFEDAKEKKHKLLIQRKL